MSAPREYRLNTPYSVVCPIRPPDILEPDGCNGRLNLTASLHKPGLRKRALSAGIIAYRKQHGVIQPYLIEARGRHLTLVGAHNTIPIAGLVETEEGVKTTDFDEKETGNVELVVNTPIAPWAEEFDAMSTYTGNGRVLALHDMEDSMLQQYLTHEGKMMAYALLHYGHQNSYISLGSNHGAGSKAKRGFNTIFDYHNHARIHAGDVGRRSIEEIRAQRNTEEWDGGISRHFAEIVSPMLRKALSEFPFPIDLQIDNMGITIHVPDCTLNQLNKQFVDLFTKQISLVNHYFLRGCHYLGWGHINNTTYDEAIDYLHNAKLNGFKQEEFDQYFPELPNDGKLPDFDTDVLMEWNREDAIKFYNKLVELRKEDAAREFSAWALDLEERQNGLLALITYGFLRGNAGPVEGEGVKLIRPERKITKAEQKVWEVKHRNAAEYALAG